MDVAIAATEIINQDQDFTSNVCGVNAKCATYIFISGFRVSTVEQKGLNNIYMTRFCSPLQCSVSLQQARKCRLPQRQYLLLHKEHTTANMVAGKYCSLLPHEA